MIDDIHYEYIKREYEGKTAKRSKLPYIQHIDDGLIILNHLKSPLTTKQAWCLHPLFQNDESLKKVIDDLGYFDKKAIVLAMEFRNIANSYLTKDILEKYITPSLSSLPEVNEMLIVDKIQNYKDFKLYQDQDQDHYGFLEKYFRTWFKILEIDTKKFEELYSLIV